MFKFHSLPPRHYVGTYFGKHSLSRYEEYQDMNVRIKVTKTFKLIEECDS